METIELLRKILYTMTDYTMKSKEEKKIIEIIEEAKQDWIDDDRWHTMVESERD